MKLLLQWQFLSLLVTGCGVFSQLLSSHGINAPTFQSMLVYAVLLIGYGIPRFLEFLQGNKLQVDWWKYAVLGIIDVEANFLVVMAYQYTTIESVQLLDSFSIPCVMVISYCWLKHSYTWSHLVGVVGCFVGLVLLVVSDMQTSRNGIQDPQNKIIGDVITLCGAALYAVSNVFQEYLVKKYDRKEMLAGIGFFGLIVSGIQVIILERNNIPKFNDYITLLYMVGFLVCMFAFYSLVPILLQMSSATYMNLSLLTSDFFSVLFAVFLFDAHLIVLYFGSFVIIIISLILYNLAEAGYGIPWIYDKFLLFVCLKEEKLLTQDEVTNNNDIVEETSFEPINNHKEPKNIVGESENSDYNSVSIIELSP